MPTTSQGRDSQEKKLIEKIIEKIIEMELEEKELQQIPDNHTMLNHTTLLFAPNLPGIKWNITNFALIMAQKALIITQFLSSFLHLIFPFISFCQPESI